LSPAAALAKLRASETLERTVPSRLSKLSVDEIRERYARADEPVSAQTLSKLKRDPRHGVRAIYEALKKRYERDSAERTRLDAMLNFERVLWRAGVLHIAGVDEVGMGPLAGPVIAAAVVFPPPGPPVSTMRQRPVSGFAAAISRAPRGQGST